MVVNILTLISLDLSKLTLPAIIVGAAIDSINPCAIGVLIFLAAYIVKVFKSRRMMLLGAGLYIAAVYVTYFLSGLGLLTIIQNISIAYYFYWIAIFISFGAAAFEIKDFFWYGKGISMQILPGSAKRIKLWAKAFERFSHHSPKISLLLTIPIGFGAAAVELPCTGQVYLAILALMRTTPTHQWLPLLLLYNFIFVLPLIIIAALLFVGISSNRMEKWRKKHRKYMRLMTGLFLYGLGALLLWYIYNEFPSSVLTNLFSFILFASQVSAISYVLYKGFFNGE